MIVKCKNKEIGWLKLAMQDDVFNYSAVVTLTTLEQLGALVFTVEDEAGNVFPYEVIRNEVQNGSQFQYTAYPQSYVKLLNATTNLVNGDYTLLALGDAVGVGSVVTPHKVTVYSPSRWTLPRLCGVGILDEMIKGGCASGGGCSSVRFNTAGACECMDLILCYNVGEVVGSFYAQPQLGVKSREYVVSQQGVITFYFYNEDTEVVETYKFMEGYGAASVYKYISNNAQQDRIVSAVRNGFWRQWFNSSTVSFQGAMINNGTVRCGGIMQLDKMDGDTVYKYLVLGYDTTYQPSQGSVVNMRCVEVGGNITTE